MYRPIIVGAFIWSMCGAATAQERIDNAAADDIEHADELLHSDLPLFNTDYEEFYPYHYVEGQSFGCATIISVGDWTYSDHQYPEDEDVWYRFGLAGAIHCSSPISFAYERESLDIVATKPGFFAKLGPEATERGDVELWVLQTGARPGSDYLLLSRPISDGPIKQFDVLQSECPDGAMREGDGLDVFVTSYCVLTSREQVTALARKMVHRPPLGRLEFRGQAREGEAEPD